MSKNMNVLILGCGISGIGAAQTLLKRGDRVLLSDVAAPAGKDQLLAELEQEGAELRFGPQSEALLQHIEVIIPSPGIPVTHPLLQAAYTARIAVWSEVELAYRLSAAPIVAITGTNGKTTTTSLVGEMFAADGRQTAVGGNIGQPLSRLAAGMTADGVLVAEVSSFQLETVVEFRPRVAVILNLTPDHLDRHGDMANYGSIKERIFAQQQGTDVTVLNADDPLVAAMATRSPAQVCLFSQRQQLEQGVFVRAGMIVARWQGQEADILPVQDIPLPGAHNVENVLAACAACYTFGVAPTVIAQTVRSFGGVEHRIEFVRDRDGVKYYNDSKATNPESTMKAIEAFPPGIILIAGGKDKNTPLEPLMDLVRQRVGHLILLGQAKERFAAAARAAGVEVIHLVADMTEAVDVAGSLAETPQVVLLSPACASYDQFANFEERGRCFKALVQAK